MMTFACGSEVGADFYFAFAPRGELKIRMDVIYPFHSLDDFLKSKMLDVDGQLDDGWGAKFPVKGRLIKAAIMFADISGFSEQTKDLSPIETLIFVNNYFSWMTAEGLRGTHGVVDKYIGDELMVVFAREFGSADPVNDAVTAARWMIEHDPLDFRPRIGIAFGEIVAGYVGTPLSFNASVFGHPVTLASRCCSTKLVMNGLNGMIISADAWGPRRLEDVLKPRSDNDGKIIRRLDWTAGELRKIEMKNIGEQEVIELCYLEAKEGMKAIRVPPSSLEERATQNFQSLQKQGCVQIRRYPFEPDYEERGGRKT